MQGREEPLDLYGPKPARKLLEVMLFSGTERLAFDARIHEVAPGDEVRRDGCRLVSYATEHKLASCGWALVEDDRPGRFHVERAVALGVPPGPLFGELQHGRAVILPSGGRVEPGQVVDAARRGRKVVLTGDTRPCAATVAMAAGADLLVHDSTFGDAEEARAVETLHSTAREAARVAREAGVGRLLLTHLSTRYDRDSATLLQQAREEFGAVEVASDGLVVELPLPG
jgi:ribonuclease Z